MKLVYCPKCNYLFELRHKHVFHCLCEENQNGGKYLNDGLVAIVTEDAVVVGIDNNSFRDCTTRYKQHNPKGEEPWDTRIDFFFTGWIPTIPGEIVRVDTIEEVVKFPCDTVVGDGSYTMPVSQEVIRCNKRVCYCDNNGVCKHYKG